MAGNYPGPSSSPMAHTGPGLAWLLPSTTLRNTHTRVHALSETHLAGAGTPQVHAGPQPHAEHVEGGPVH